MTFAALRALHSIIGDALDDIERIYRDASHDSPTPNTPYTVLAGIVPSTPYLRRGSRDEDALAASSSPDDDLSTSVTRSPKTPLHRRPRTREGPGGIPFPHSNPHTSAGSREGTVQQLDFPGLDAAYYPTEGHDPDVDAAEALASHPDVIAATNRVVAACGQISAMVHRPFLTLCDAAMGYHLPACLRFLEESHTVEILRSAGPHGMHVRELSRHVNVDEGKLSHMLRLLATHHITREVRPNVFANNRISAILDSGKAWEEVQRTPQEKYEGTNGIAAFINLCTDELFKSSAYLADCYLPSRSGKPSDDVPLMHAPFNLAFDTKTPYFEWLERPGNEMRLKRFGPAMTGTAAWEIPGAVISAFPWHDLPDGSLVVDVGGGIGSTSMLLAHAFQHLKFVIQDRPQVAEQGVAAWRERCPELLDSGRATFLGHDFFCPQPPLVLPGSGSTTTPADPVTPAVYILRVVTHDWPDSFAIKILLNLRRAASPHTKLLIADHILPHACVDDHEDLDVNGERLKLPGMVRSFAPEGSPLLPNLGKANANAYWLDLTMRVAFNAQERTLREMAVLTASAGWKIVDVVHGEDSLFGHITAVPTEIPEETLKLLLDPPPNEPAQSAVGNRARSASTKSVPESVRMNNTFGTHTALPTEEAIRKPARARKTRRSLLPWLKNKPATDAKTAGNASQQVTPENQTDSAGSGSGSGSGGKQSKAHSRKPKLSILTSPSSSMQERDRAAQSGSMKPQHTRTGSVVRILSHASKSVVNLTLQDAGAGSSAVKFRDDQSIPLPGSGRGGHGHGHSSTRSPGSRSRHNEDVPPVPPLLPALELGGRGQEREREREREARVKPMPSRTSLRKKASQVFGLGKASMANLRAAALGGGEKEKEKERGGVGSPISATRGDRERMPPDGNGKEGRGSGRARSESKAQLGGPYVTVEMRARGDGSVEPGWSGE